MTPLQRLLILLVVLAAGGVLAGALLLGEKEGPLRPGAETPSPGRSTSAEAPRPRPDRLAGMAQGGRKSAQEGPAGRLELRLLDEDGRPISGEVIFTGPEGRTIEATEGTLWESFPVGEWKLLARSEGLIPYEESFELEEGQTLRLTAKLLSKIEIDGVVVDRFGQGVGGVNLWFLRRDQSHPVDFQAGRKIKHAVSDTRGRFRVTIEHKGKIRVSVGRPGEKELESDPIEFHSGGPTHGTIVVSGTARLEIELENPPPGIIEGKASPGVAVLAAKETSREKRKRRPGSGKHKKSARPESLREGGRAKNQLAAGAEAGRTGPAEDADPVAPAQSNPGNDRGLGAGPSPTLVTLAKGNISTAGTLSFQALPPNREIIVELERRGDFFRSDPLRLVADQATVVRFSLPKRRSEQERAKTPYGQLVLSSLVRPLPSDAPPLGFTWE